MRLLMVAPPGAGKGTQGALIAAHFGIPHIATGELLRDHVARRTEIGRRIEQHVESGDLISDELVMDLVRREYDVAKAAGGGYVLDGVPRTMDQARALYLIGVELKMNANVVLHLKANDEELTRRLLARAAIEHRSDDTADVIEQRLKLYHQVTHPIIDWYAERGILVTVDAMRPAAAVGRDILENLEVMRTLVDYVPENLRRPIDLTDLHTAFGHDTVASRMQ